MPTTWVALSCASPEEGELRHAVRPFRSHVGFSIFPVAFVVVVVVVVVVPMAT